MQFLRRPRHAIFRTSPRPFLARQYAINRALRGARPIAYIQACTRNPAHSLQAREQISTMTDTLATRADTSANSAPRKLRIGLMGWTGIENLGNDALLEAGLHFFRERLPDAELISIGSGPELVEQMFGISGPNMRWLPKNRWLRAVDKLMLKVPSGIANAIICERTLSKLDYFVVTGGSLIDDYRTHSLDRPLTLRRWFGTAKRLGVKIVYVSVGAERVRKKNCERMVKPLIGMSAYRSYRDQCSRDYVQTLGYDESATPVYPDLVWGMPEPLNPPRPADGPLTVGVGVMAYHGWKSIEAGVDIHERYVAQMTELVDWLADNGYRVRMLVGEKSDRRVVEAIRQRARAAGGPMWAGHAPAKDIHELMRQITETDLVIATRFHNILCALKLGRPTLSISYMPKNSELLELVGTPGFHQPLEGLDVELLKKQFLDLAAQRETLAATIGDHVVGIKARLKDQEARLLRDVFGAPS
jgi:polysaccharide pyruvyl transferase WcaK-like protein